MSPSKAKTLYVRESDAKTWEKAEQRAKEEGQSLSTVIARLLDSYTAAQQETGELVIDMRDNNGREWQEGFRGRWLIEPGDDNRYGEDAGMAYGIAQTAKGKIAVYGYHVNDLYPPFLSVYDNLDAAQEDLSLAEEVIAGVASDLGETRVVWRDI